MSKKEHEQEIMDFLLERGFEERDKTIARASKVATTNFVREQLFLDDFQLIAKKVFKNKFPAPRTIKKSNKSIKRILNLLVSDTHIGSWLDEREVGHKFGPTEEARRMASVFLQTAGYKMQYRDDTHLTIFLDGDIIQNQLHDMRDGGPLAEQCAAAIHILAQGIRFLAHEFPNGITVWCTPGNHGRFTSRHKERATNQRFDALETVIYFGIKTALSNYSNVTVNIPYTPYIIYNAFNKRGFVCHGDSTINVGYPNKNINVKSIREQINSINAAAGKKGKEYDLFAVGHVHIASMVHLPGNSILITNGCIIPTDSYAQSIGIFETTNGQWIWESVPDHIVGDSRFIVVDEKDDKDRSLDSIIKPYSGL